LRKGRLTVAQQRPIRVFDEDGTLIGDYFADLLVGGQLVVELKTAKKLAPEHWAVFDKWLLAGPLSENV